MSDPVAAFIRSEREALLRAAPPPDAARLWHAARRRREAALRRATAAVGWLIRCVVAAATLLSLVPWRPGSNFLLLILVISVWLTHGACAPARHPSEKGPRP